MNSFDEPVVLLAGGRDKRLPWEEAARLMHHKVHSLILFGEATEIIVRAIEHVRSEITKTRLDIHRCSNLEEAVRLAAQIVHPGDVVLLSPGCASFDAFRSFAERGERFEEFVMQL